MPSYSMNSSFKIPTLFMTLSYLQVQMKKLRRHFPLFKKKKTDKEGCGSKGLCGPKSQRKQHKPQNLKLQKFRCL